MTEQQKKISPFISYRTLVEKWTPRQRFAVLGLALVVLLLSVWFVQLYRVSGFQLLYGGLAPQELNSATRWLDDRYIDYRVDLQQGAIHLPADRVHQVRMEMAERGIPEDRQEPYELIDGGRLGLAGPLSEGAYRIALQNDLARTIAALDFVQSARVHLTAAPGSASSPGGQHITVLLKLESGRHLQPGQLLAITHLLDGAVTGLDGGSIKIIDSSGNLLDPGSGVANSGFVSDALAFQKNVENKLETRAREILERMTGGGALVSVTAEIDFSRSETTAERFDPDEPAIRMEESHYQVGATADGGALPAAGDGLLSAQTSRSKIDYELNKTTSRTTRPEGAIDKLSVTLLIPEKRVVDPDGSVSYRALTDEQLDNIAATVSAALALKPERGDLVHLATIPATAEIYDTQPQESSGVIDLFTYLPLARTLLAAVGFLLLYVLVIRPLLGMLSSDGPDRPLEIADKEEEASQPAEISEEDLVLVLKDEVLSNPVPAAYILKKWMQET